MFFRKHSEPRPLPERSGSVGANGSPQLKAANGGATRPSPVRSNAVGNIADEISIGLVLDALGGVLSALARFPLELPDKPADESADEISAWQRHATMGYPVGESASPAAVGIRDRDWAGLVRAVTAQRREEHRMVTSSIADLREALWACVETVHKAVQLDHQTDQTEIGRAHV